MTAHAVGLHPPRRGGELPDQHNFRLHTAALVEGPARTEETRARLAHCVADTMRIPQADLDACETLSQQISQRAFNLVVAGQFKRGKSSVINALLGDSLLPTGVVPLTSIVTAVRYGPTLAARVIDADGREQPIAPKRSPTMSPNAATRTIPGGSGR